MVLAATIPWLQISAVFQVLLSAFLITLVLMHSGREAGLEESVRPLVEVRLADLERLARESPPPGPPAS